MSAVLNNGRILQLPVVVVIVVVIAAFHSVVICQAEDDTGSRSKTVTVQNTFEDPVLTGGIQVPFGPMGGPVDITADMEFPNFINLYDIDVSKRSINMTLVNNSIVSDLIMPDGRFDRYYFTFHKTVAYAEVVNTKKMMKKNDISASTIIMEPGYSFEINDPFETGLTSPLVYPNGGLIVEIGPDSNLTDLGQTLMLRFALGKPGDFSCEIESFVLWDANDDMMVGPLEDEIDLCELGASGFTIQAVAPCADKVKFKLFDDDGVIIKKTEKVPPYVLGGDVNGDLNPVDALNMVGNYTIKAVTPKIPGSPRKKQKFEVVANCV